MAETAPSAPFPASVLGCLVRNPRGDEPAVAAMRRRLDKFYQTTTTYDAFNETQTQSDRITLLDPILDSMIAGGRTVRVLELGAGRTWFPDGLGDRRSQVHYTAQDVTNSNEEYLRERADAVHIGDISLLKGQYDLIFSQFVLEHVSAPSSWLAHVDRLLAPGGWHGVFCPRYDVPGYLSPSLRSMPAAKRIALHTFLAASRLKTILGAEPRFWVNLHPAVFDGPWYRDADAVHIVSRFDVERWHRRRGYRIRRLFPQAFSFQDWILKRQFLVALAAQKHG